jgi:hypothetical protein
MAHAALSPSVPGAAFFYQYYYLITSPTIQLSHQHALHLRARRRASDFRRVRLPSQGPPFLSIFNFNHTPPHRTTQHRRRGPAAGSDCLACCGGLPCSYLVLTWEGATLSPSTATACALPAGGGWGGDGGAEGWGHSGTRPVERNADRGRPPPPHTHTPPPTHPPTHPHPARTSCARCCRRSWPTT